MCLVFMFKGVFLSILVDFCLVSELYEYVEEITEEAEQSHELVPFFFNVFFKVSFRSC